MLLGWIAKGERNVLDNPRLIKMSRVHVREKRTEVDDN